jgi:purine-binding chemotaxis protein CheW
MQNPRREILVFELGGRRYGLAATDVRELVRAVTIVPTPRASAVLEGIINLRGVVVPVLDIRSRLGLPAKAVELSDHLVVVESRNLGGRPLALRVDRPLELASFDATTADEAGEPASEGDDEFAEVAILPGGLVPVLDLRDFVSADDAAEIGTLPAAAEGQPS